MNIPDEFERLITEDKIKFKKASLEDLSSWGRMIVSQFLETAGVEWELGDVILEGSVCLKLKDPQLHYLDILEGSSQFLWAGEGHHEGIHPDDASAYLISLMRPGLSIKTVRNEETGLRRMIFDDGDSSVVVDDLRDLIQD